MEGEWTYSSTFSVTSALDGVGGLSHTTAALPLGTQCIGGGVGPEAA